MKTILEWKKIYPTDLFYWICLYLYILNINIFLLPGIYSFVHFNIGDYNYNEDKGIFIMTTISPCSYYNLYPDPTFGDVFTFLIEGY